MQIIKKTVTVTTTGNAGSATGSGTMSGVVGFLLDVYLDFHADAHANTDTTIAYGDQGGNILEITDSKSDALYAPRQKCVDNANSAITNSHTMFPIDQKLTVSIAQSTAQSPCLTATFRILQY